jgi:ABC-type branched-subunit amino acid transport system substrate-binding protein
MVIAPLTSQGGAGVPVAPEIPVGAEAAAAQINDGGGVNGKSMTIVPCDTGGTANGPAECARLAVQDHVIAVVGSTDDGSELPELQAAGIPDVADIPAGAEYTSSDSFPIMGEAPVLLAGMVSVPAKTGAKSVSIVTNSGAAVAGVSALLKLIEARYPAVTVKVIPIPSTAVDLSAVVAQAEQSQVIGLSPNNLDSLAAFISAYNQSANKKPLISNDFTISSAAITQLGHSLDGATILSNFLPSTDTSDSDVATYDKWMSDINPSVNKDSESANAYDGVLLFAQLARQIKNVSAASLIEALDHAGTIQLPMLPTFNMSKPAAGVGPFTRISNADLTVSTVKNGTITTSGGQFINPYVP